MGLAGGGVGLRGCPAEGGQEKAGGVLSRRRGDPRQGPLYGAEVSFQIHVHPEPQAVTLFGSRSWQM